MILKDINLSEKNTNSSEQKLLDYLFSLNRRDIKPGLERINTLLEFLGNPQNSYPTIHIAGTNGKGSVAAFIASILMESNLDVGLYTSPHIFKFGERIKVNNKMIDYATLAEIYEMIKDKAVEISATFFEITTAVAFYYFKDKVDIAVVETGMGGRFDATNVLQPLVSVITKIGKDHFDYLGKSLQDIAKEKAGIIKSNIPVVSANNQKDVNDILASKAYEVGTEIYILNNEIKNENIFYTNDMNMEVFVEIDGEKVKLISPLIGEQQVENINIAIKAIQLLKDKYNITNEAIVSGVKNVVNNTLLHFRIELIDDKLPIIIDVAHNEDALKVLVSTIRQATSIEKWDIVFGAMKDKDTKSMLSAISPICKNLIIMQPTTGRAEEAEQLVNLASNLEFENIINAETAEVAAQIIKQNANPTIICGSFYTANEMFEALYTKQTSDE